MRDTSGAKNSSSLCLGNHKNLLNISVQKINNNSRVNVINIEIGVVEIHFDQLY